LHAEEQKIHNICLFDQKNYKCYNFCYVAEKYPPYGCKITYPYSYINVFFHFKVFIFAMGPKCKPTIAPKGAKPTKKTNSIKTEDDEGVEKDKSGKVVVTKGIEESGFYCFKGKVSSPELVDKNVNKKGVEFPNITLNQLVQQKSKNNMLGSLWWKTFLFPPVSKVTSFVKPTHQYFGLDLVDEDKDRTYWTHKASVWQDLFALVNDLAKTQQAAPTKPAFEGILSCPVCAIPNGPNEIKTFMSGNHKNIQYWIMLICMPADMGYTEYVPIFLHHLQALSKRADIRSAYKSGVAIFSQHPAMLNQVSDEGQYWNVLQDATEKEVIFQSCPSLSEVLMDSTIKEVVSLTFGVKKDQVTWSDGVKAYAFGN
jgi:hypothetical protein